jgi:hypothetical protein
MRGRKILRPAVDLKCAFLIVFWGGTEASLKSRLRKSPPIWQSKHLLRFGFQTDKLFTLNIRLA